MALPPIRFQLNPGLDRQALAAAYQAQGWVQATDLFVADVADQLYDTLEKHTPWHLTVHQDGGKPRLLSQADWRALAPGDLEALMRDATTRAGAGFSYVYMCYPMIDAYVQGRDAGHPLHSLTEFLNSNEMLSFARDISGHDDVVKMDAQATFYRPGDFLTLHDDRDKGQRLAAYTLGFSRGWRPDWGGQLMFHTPSNDIERGFIPRFNTMTLFRVPTLHSVAPVAPYARNPRLSVTGWLRNDPPVK
jgi:SM-20-related protein